MSTNENPKSSVNQFMNENSKSLVGQFMDGMNKLLPSVNKDDNKDNGKDENSDVNTDILAGTVPNLNQFNLSDTEAAVVDADIETIVPVRQAGGNMDENSDFYKMKYYKYKHLYLNAK